MSLTYKNWFFNPEKTGGDEWTEVEYSIKKCKEEDFQSSEYD